MKRADKEKDNKNKTQAYIQSNERESVKKEPKRKKEERNKQNATKRKNKNNFQEINRK